jgi:hypothetical protein
MKPLLIRDRYRVWLQRIRLVGWYCYIIEDSDEAATVIAKGGPYDTAETARSLGESSADRLRRGLPL